jgi:hypothetical protein
MPSSPSLRRRLPAAARRAKKRSISENSESIVEVCARKSALAAANGAHYTVKLLRRRNDGDHGGTKTFALFQSRQLCP